MIVRPRDAAQFRQSGNLAPTHRLFPEFGGELSLRDVDPSDRINRHQNRANFATYWFDRFPVFLPRFLHPLYNLSAFHTTALTCLKSPMRKLHLLTRPTYHNLSVHVMEPRRGGFHLSLSWSEAISFVSSLFSRLASFIDVQENTLVSVSASILLRFRCSPARSCCRLYVELFFERVLLVCLRLLFQ